MASYLSGIIACLLLWVCSGGGYTSSSIAARIAEREGPAVAFVVVERDGAKSQGSGIVIDGAQGHFLTNWHVIKGIREGWVRVQGAKWMPIVAVVAKDEHKDLALVKADLGDQVLHKARLGSVTGIKPGDPVVAIGNPLGEEFSVTDGIVSQIRNQEGYKVVQTTAPISPGNSGGPLFNERGEVIGVVTFTKQDTARRAQNLNYAVAIDEAKPLLDKTDYEDKVVPGIDPPDFLSPSRLSVLSGSLRWGFVGDHHRWDLLIVNVCGLQNPHQKSGSESQSGFRSFGCDYAWGECVGYRLFFERIFGLFAGLADHVCQSHFLVVGCCCCYRFFDHHYFDTYSAS